MNFDFLRDRQSSAREMSALQKNIVDQIASGFVTIESIRDFSKILKRFPHDPVLRKVAADLMMRKNMAEKAALSYHKAASLFLKSGSLLPAIASIVSSWRINPPSYRDANLFLSAVRDDSFPRTPLKIFLQILSNPEIMAIVKRFENLQMGEKQLLQKVNDIQDTLYFIVTGSVKETRFQPLKTKNETIFKRSIYELSADDTIGELYPIDEEKTSQSYVETISAVDLIRLPKPALVEICRRYPNVESGLQAVDAFRAEFQRENRLKKNRKETRHQLNRRICVEIHPQASGSFPIILEGYSTDISIGGTCVVLNARDLGVTEGVAAFAQTIKNSKVKISFPTEGLELKVSGKIAWTQKVIFQSERTLTLGIQFQNLSPKMRGMLFVFAGSQ
ncbi:MAG: PilZ domain-containing protein [Desulfobacterales bacterium]|nr:PilZ domain-containing protein [Desulfobacterales bacterium]